ncbi:MAG: DUF4097 family beta strand repeat protein [Candidatus Eremiobacteraeota bacterium]|nr:DUF4097 family beta strand repeat protein [Candidatus Eremiobacteraeota bacterium]
MTSRASVVGVLIAVEVVIVAVAVFVIGGSGWRAPGIFDGSFHHVAFAAEPLAPVDAGSTPQVTIDDEDSRVVLGLSADGKVHVRDLTSFRGNVFSQDGQVPQLQVTHSGDTVTIARPSQHVHLDFFMFGASDRRIQVDVPRDARVTIVHCAGADVAHLAGAVNVYSQDGHITLTDLSGPVDAHSDDGSIEAVALHGPSLSMQSADGHVSMRDVSVGALTATTNDGHIEASNLDFTGSNPVANVHTDDGSVELALASVNLTVNASTSDGSVTVNGSHIDSDDDSVSHTFRLGDGSGNLKVSSNDGSIHITTTNGAL